MKNVVAGRLPVILIADNIRSLYNVGSLFRVGDGVNLEAIYLCGITGYPVVEGSDVDERPNWVAERADKEIRKTGLAGVEALPFRYFNSTGEAVAAAKAAGYSVVALELTEESVDYRSFEYQFPLAVIVGHETDGVELGLLQQVPAVHLPMAGRGKSLNVATSAAAFLYFITDRYSRSQ